MTSPAFLFDLDGTLVDSVYQHVLAWRDALEAEGIALAVWRIHRRIGMSGGLFVNALLRETGRAVTPRAGRPAPAAPCARRTPRLAPQVRPLPGRPRAAALPDGRNVPWAIATSGAHGERAAGAGDARRRRGVPVVTRDQVAHAKPDPDLFLAAAERLGVDIDELGRRRRQRVGPAGRAAGAGARCRPTVRRLRPGRADARGRLPRLPGPGRSAAAPRRGGGATPPSDGRPAHSMRLRSPKRVPRP